MTRALDVENVVVIAAVQALVGAVTESMRAVAVDVDAVAGTAVLHVALRRPDPAAAALLEEVADDINQLSGDVVAVSVETWVGQDWTDRWPGRHLRMVYAAHAGQGVRT